MSFLTSNSVGSAIPGSEVNRYDFESGSAPAVDRVGNSDMSITGASFVNSPVQEGGWALDFDGTDDLGDTGIDQNTSNAFTVCLWTYPRNEGDNEIITGVWGTASNAEWQIATDVFEGFDGSSSPGFTHSMTNNQWHFKAFVWDGSTFEGFSGGPSTSVSSDGSKNLGSMQDTGHNIRLGLEVGGAKDYNGVIDMWRRFDVALSQSQLETVRQADA